MTQEQEGAARDLAAYIIRADTHNPTADDNHVMREIVLIAKDTESATAWNREYVRLARVVLGL